MNASAAARAGWRRDDLMVAAGLAALAYLLAAGAWLWRADRVWYDFALSLWSRPPPGDIVIVAIDDASIEAIGRWPWPRAVHSTLLERLARARPRATLVDLVLSEPDPDPGQDALLARALRDAAPVVMPVAWQVAPGTSLRPLEPVPVLRAAVQLGAGEPTVDDDGVLRHAFARAGPAHQQYPHLALALLQAGREPVHPAVPFDTVDAETGAALWLRQDRFLIRYTGPPGHVSRVSYVDVLRGAVPASALQGRYVLVGMTAQGLGDTLATPVNGRRHAMPGIEVHAHTLQTLRSGDAVRALGPVAAGLWSAGLVLMLVAAFVLSGTRAALGLALLSVPVVATASLLALNLGWWWSPVPYVFAAALAYPLWSWRRLERSVDLLDREIARLATEPDVLPLRVDDADAPTRDHLAARVAALHTAAETVRSARSFLAEALEGAPTAMLVDDGAGRVTLANRLAATLFEIESPQEMQGLDLSRLLGEFATTPAVTWSEALTEVRRTDRGLAVEARLEAHSDYVIHVRSLRMRGLMRLIVAIADVAAIKQAERAREELLAFVSHDLRAPAASIKLLADMQLDGRSEMDQAALLGEVRRLAQRTLNLAEDFVRVAAAASRPLQPEPVSLSALLAEVVADFRPQAQAASVSLLLRAPQADTRFSLDPSLIARAMGNLVSNAVRHSPPGGVVEVGWSCDGRRAVLSVVDQGPGLSPEAMQHLMQADQGLAPGMSRGVGFGLVFVQRVVRRHGGHLAVTPGVQGRGVRFELHLESAPGKP